MYMPSYQPRRRFTPAKTPANASPDVVQAWREKFPAEWAWIENGLKADNEFAGSLNGYLNRKGFLTDGQHACVTRSIAQAPARAAAAADRVANAPAVEIDGVSAAFARAKAAGIKRPKIVLADYRFTPAPATGSNPGAIYLKATETDTYLGKVMDGKFIRSRDCTPEMGNDVLRVMADPVAAAIAHGKEFGVCSCCNRALTDPESVARGIGPVCFANYFGGQ